MAPRFLASKDEVSEVLDEIKSDSCSFDEGVQMVLPSLLLREVGNGAEDKRGKIDSGPYNKDDSPARETTDRVGIQQSSPGLSSKPSSANQAPTLPPRNGVAPPDQMPRETRALVDAYLKRQDRKARDARLQEISDSQEQHQQQKPQQQQRHQKAEQTSLPQPAGNDTSTKQTNTRDFSGALMKHLPDSLAHVNTPAPSVAELRKVANFLDQRIKKTFGSGIDTFINKSEQAASEQQGHQHQQRPQPQIHPQFYQLQQKIEQQKQLVKGPNASPLTDPSVEGGLQDSISLEEYENPDVDDSEWEWIGPEG